MMRKVFTSFSVSVLFLMGLASFADEPKEVSPHRGWSFREMGLVPVQSGGRVKPLDSFAREVVLFETGSRSFEGWKAVDLVLSWMAAPQLWSEKAFIRVDREDVRRQLGLDEKRSRFSPEELFRNPSLIQYAERMGKGSQAADPRGAAKSNPREQELKAVLDRVGVFHNTVSGQGWPLIPKRMPEAWGNLMESGAEGDIVRTPFIELLKAYQEGRQGAFERSSELLKAAVEGEIPGYSESFRGKILAEYYYNSLRPFGFAWGFYLLAAIIWVLALYTPPGRKWADYLAGAVTVSAVLSHVFGIALRCYVAGRPPVTNMYESVIWVSFGVLVFAGVLYWMHRQKVILAVACALATLGLVAGDSAPAILDPSLNPLVPVLRSNYWLTIHVLTITLGYAAFALALGLANITLYQFWKNAKMTKIQGLNQLTYRATQFGVVLIAAGTILGGIWADYSWGRFWGWDPKEVWALITLLAYLVILHGRYTQWVGQFGFAAWSALSFMTVVMAWYGVNFILGVGLHSYGFSTGGTPWVIGFVVLQLSYVGWVTWVHSRQKRTR